MYPVPFGRSALRPLRGSHRHRGAHREYQVRGETIHPDVSGRPQVLAMHERLFEHMNSKPGVRFVTMREIADDFRRRQPRA